MPAGVNHYETLGVSSQATPDQIRLAYRRAVRVCHPDHNDNDPVAAELFGMLTKAYKSLRDPEERLALDVSLGLGAGYKAWYGKTAGSGHNSSAAGGLGKSGRLSPTGPTATAAAALVANGLSAGKVAASLIEAGSSYEQAWELAWHARHDQMADRMQQPAAAEIAPTTPLNAAQGEWQPYRGTLWSRLREGMGRILG